MPLHHLQLTDPASSEAMDQSQVERGNAWWVVVLIQTIMSLVVVQLGLAQESALPKIDAAAEATAPDPAEPPAAAANNEIDGEPAKPDAGNQLPNGVGNPEGPAAEAAAEPVVLPGLLPERGKCVVSGEVYDKDLKPVAGVFIDVRELSFRAQTDAQGKFRIEGMPDGTFTFEASKLGYNLETKVLTLIEAQPAVANFSLSIKPVDDGNTVYTLEEETIIGEYSGDSPGDLFLDLTVTPTLSSGLSEEDFAKNAVSDAGEAVEKISGANVVDGKFAVVRGLADRYITTTLNGGAISSAVPSRKAVRLDLFPTSAMSGINVDKIYTPYLSGDFGGAAIDLRTKVFPTEPVVDFKFKQGFDPSLPSKMMLSADKELDYFGGLDEGHGRDALIGSDGRLITESIQGDVLLAWQTLHSSRSLLPAARGSEQAQSFSTTIGNTIELADGIRFGLLAAGGVGGSDDYNASQIFTQGTDTWYQEEFTREREWNVYLAAGLELGEFNEIRALYFRKNIAQQNVTTGSGGRNERFDETGTNLDNLWEQIQNAESNPNTGVAANPTDNFYEIDPVEQDLQLLQLSGKHQLGRRGPKFRWGITESNAIEDRPNYSYFETTTLDYAYQPLLDSAGGTSFEWESGFIDALNGVPGSPGDFTTMSDRADLVTYVATLVGGDVTLAESIVDSNLIGGGGLNVDPSLGQVDTLAGNQFQDGEPSFGNTIYRNAQSVIERTEDNSFGMDIPIYFNKDNEDRGLSFGFGMSDMNKARKTSGSVFALITEEYTAGSYRGGLTADQLSALGELFADDPNALAGFLTGGDISAPYYVDDTTGNITLIKPDGSTLNLVNNVDGSHDLQAHYLSADFFWDDHFIRAGWRFESETREYSILQPRPLLPGYSGRIEESDVMSSLSAGTSLFDGKLSLLAAWSETVARPTFHEWFPTQSIDLSTFILRQGNPNLENATIENIDVSALWEIHEDSNLRVSLFDKKITDPIVELFLTSERLTYSNGDEGNLQGVEVEYEHNNLGPFSFGANLTYIDAELAYTVEGANGLETTTEQFPYQPEWIANANLGYEHEDWDLGVNLIYNFVGEHNTIVRRREAEANLVLDPLHSLDLVVRKGFGRDDEGGGWLIVAGVKNLWSTDKEYYWDGGAADTDGRLRNRDAVERTYFIEAKCSF